MKKKNRYLFTCINRVDNRHSSAVFIGRNKNEAYQAFLDKNPVTSNKDFIVVNITNLNER